MAVDFRYRCSLSAGLAVSLLGFACGVSPVQRFPQESSTFRSNQLCFYNHKENVEIVYATAFSFVVVNDFI
ncbi:hypothetical protein [Rossellomorea aquimaris]|uniref:hypothetical protein n=1 Tax=Rossellomorea aquimaris TaxID=189382 RepID=UPI001CFC49E1|nr:hypothetical protein [Rossellomorea aquimaris]